MPCFIYRSRFRSGLPCPSAKLMRESRKSRGPVRSARGKKPQAAHLTVSTQCVATTYHDSSDPSLCTLCGFAIERNGLRAPSHSCSVSMCVCCFRRILDQQFAASVPNLFCPVCLVELPPSVIEQIHPELSAKISEIVAMEMQNTECRFCGYRFQFDPCDSPTLDQKPGLSARDRDEQKHCMVCYSCHISSCVSCGAVPFHLHETCQEHKWYVEGYVCRICGCAANPSNNEQIPLLLCGKPECGEIAEQMCTHVHQCGHACVGILGETTHPSCPECAIAGTKCPACKEQLWGKPCIALGCKHVIHKECAIKMMDRSRTGPDVELPLCPTLGCGEFVRHPVIEAAAPAQCREWKSIYTQVERVAECRVEAEGLADHPDVVSKWSPFSGDPVAWAKKKLRYRICQKHTPWLIYAFGRLEDPTPRTVLTCPRCNEKDSKFPMCDTCGYDYMQYKCDTCCSIGTALRQKELRKQQLVWYCDNCVDNPAPKMTVKRPRCKGNCGFAPHSTDESDQRTLYVGKCVKCGKIYPPYKSSRR